MASDPRNVHFRFLELPRELRDRIYDFAIEPILRIHRYADGSRKTPVRALLQANHLPTPGTRSGLMRCCQQIRVECLVHLLKDVLLLLELARGFALETLSWLDVHGNTVVPYVSDVWIFGWDPNYPRDHTADEFRVHNSIKICLSPDLEPFKYIDKNSRYGDYRESVAQVERFVRGLETNCGRRHLTFCKLLRIIKTLTRLWDINTGWKYGPRAMKIVELYDRARQMERRGNLKQLE